MVKMVPGVTPAPATLQTLSCARFACVGVGVLVGVLVLVGVGVLVGVFVGVFVRVLVGVGVGHGGTMRQSSGESFSPPAPRYKTASIRSWLALFGSVMKARCRISLTVIPARLPTV